MSHRTTRHDRARLALPVLGALAASVLASSIAHADSFAEPPHAYRRPAVAIDAYDPPEEAPSAWSMPPRSSFFRMFVGPAGKFDASNALAGLFVAMELGRGPTGFRVSGAWMDVGSQHGISQYTGELTVDFGGRARVRPVVGAGGGVARTASSVRPDGSVDETTGATIGVGVVRASLGVQLPFEEADARVGLDLTGTFPAIRGESAPELTPWLLTSLNVGVGF